MASRASGAIRPAATRACGVANSHVGTPISILRPGGIVRFRPLRQHTMSQPAWHPESFAARLPFLRRRALMTQATRAFFAARGYTEVETSYAVPVPGEE